MMSRLWRKEVIRSVNSQEKEDQMKTLACVVTYYGYIQSQYAVLDTP